MKAYWYDAGDGTYTSEDITSLDGASTIVAGLAGFVALLMSF